jgi:hypothetical protein
MLNPASFCVDFFRAARREYSIRLWCPIFFDNAVHGRDCTREGELHSLLIVLLTRTSGIKVNGQLELTHGSGTQKIAKKEPSVEIKNRNRAMRYRRLARTEPDKCKAALLRKLAEEAERGVLCTVDQMPSREVVEQYESTRL